MTERTTASGRDSLATSRADRAGRRLRHELHAKLHFVLGPDTELRRRRDAICAQFHGGISNRPIAAAFAVTVSAISKGRDVPLISSCPESRHVLWLSEPEQSALSAAKCRSG